MLFSRRRGEAVYSVGFGVHVVRIVAFVVALFAASLDVHAANVTWTTGTSSGLWATGASWLNGTSPTTGDSLFFGATTGTTALTYDIANTTPAWGGITFNSGASAYTIFGGTMTMAGGTAAIANDSTSLQTINSVFGGGFTVAGSGSLTLGGRIVSGNITKNGTGVLTLSGSNSAYAGTITASAGTVVFGTSTASGNGTALVMNGGAFQTQNSLTVGSLAMTQSGTFSFTDSGTSTHSATVGSVSGGGVLTISAVGSNSVYRKTLTLSGAANPEFSGVFSVVQAAFAVSNEASLGTNPNPLWMTAGRLLGTGTIASRTITVSSGELIGANGSANFTLTGGITGPGSVSFRSVAGLVEIGGTNDYAGLTEVYSGDAVTSTLRLVADNALPSGAGKGNFQLRPASTGNAILDLNGRSLNINGLLSSGSVSQQFIDIVAAGGNSTLTVGNGDASGTFAGTIRNTTGTIKLTKVGAGTQVLSGTNNTYGGGTDISAGILQFSRIGSMPASGTVAVQNGGTLAVGIGGAGEFTTATSGSGSIGGLLSGVGGQGNAVTWTGNVGLGIDTTSASGTYSGNIANVGTKLGITKLGSNTLTLEGNNTYSGPTTVGAGTLVLNGIQSGGGAISVNNGTLTFGAAASSANSDLTVGAAGAGNAAYLTISDTGGTKTMSKSLAFNGAVGASGLFNLNVANSGSTASVLNFGPLTTQAGFASLYAAANASANQKWNFDSLTINNGGMIYLQRTAGATLGGNVNNGTLNVIFASTPSLTGTGAAGTTSAGIVVGAATGSTGPSFVTYDANGLRVLAAGEQTALVSGMAAGRNATVAGGTAVTLTANTSVNSLRIANGNSSIALGGNTLTVTSGMLANAQANSGGTATIGSSADDGTLQFGSVNGYIISDAKAFLVINSRIDGTGGLTLAGVNSGANQVNTILAGANTISGTARMIGQYSTTVRLTNSFALQNLTLDYNNYGASFTFGNSGTTGLTDYTFGGLQGSQNIALTNNNTTPAAVALTVGGNGSSTTYSGVLSGAGGSLIKAGSGALTLTGASTYTGTTTVSSGTLQIGNGGATGSLSTSSVITNNGVLAFNRSNPVFQGVDFSGSAISGTGSLVKLGAGSLTLNAANSYTGQTRVSAGVLALGVADAISNQSSLLVDGGGFNLAGFSDTVAGVTITSGSIYGAGTLTAGTYRLGGGTVAANLGNGVLTVTGNSSLAGTSAATTVNVNAGGLVLGSGSRFTAASVAVSGSSGASLTLGGNEAFGSLAGGANVALAGNTLSVGAANTSTIYSGVLSNGALTKTGAGTLTLTGNNTHSGLTTIAGGTLAVGNGGASGSLAGNVLNNASLVFNRSDATTFANTISGSGLVRLLSGSLTLSGSNTYSGGTWIDGGTLTAGHLKAFGTGAITLASGATLDLANLLVTNAITNNGGTIRGGVITGTTSVSGDTTLDGTVAGTVTLTNNSSATIGGTVTSAAVVAVVASSTVTAAQGSSFAAGSQISNLGRFIVNASGTTPFAANMTGNGAFVVNGGGKVRLTGSNAGFSGETTVSGQGTILAVNSVLGGDVLVGAGASLGGSGLIAGDIGGDGLIGPGNSPGILTVQGQVNPTSTTSFAFEFMKTGDPIWSSGTGSQNDVLRLTNADPFVNSLTNSNVVNVYFEVSSLTNGDIFRGGFFSDFTSTALNFATEIGSPTYAYYVLGSGSGSHTYNGTNYYTLSEYLAANSGSGITGVTASVVTVPSADFAGGSAITTGQVTQFVIIPEPDTIIFAGIGIAMAGWSVWKRRRIAKMLQDSHRA